MTFYEQLVTETQARNYSTFYEVYRQGGTAARLSRKKPAPYDEQINFLVEKIRDADCVVVGGASGLSAAGGGDFYYEDNESFRKYFGRYAEKYGFKGAFSGTFARWNSREEYWGYMATFLHTTLTAPVRKPYLDLDALLKDKEFFVLTTNQDVQFPRLYPEDKVAEIQGDHRFFQCSRCCSDEVWDAVEPVQKMFEELGDGTAIPTEMIPRCPYCGAEAFPWVRGYGNFLTGKKYEGEYAKISDYIIKHKDDKILFFELGVGRLTPMFIQEPFWVLVNSLPQTSYVSINRDYAFLPEDIEARGIAIKEDIGKTLEDAKKAMGRS